MQYDLEELERQLDQMSDKELDLFIEKGSFPKEQRKLEPRLKLEPHWLGYGAIALGCMTVVGVAIAPALSPWTVDRDAYSFATQTGGTVEFCLETGYGGRKCPISYPDGRTIENYWVKPDPVQR